MALYGIYGSHSPESCPLNNVETRRLVIKMAGQLGNVLAKHKKDAAAIPFRIRTYFSMDR
jgi:hypothetical protein